jgi:predicted GTPase
VTQSSTIHKFDLSYGEHSYELYFMDTPGLGDTEGIEKDDANVENILQTIS